DDITRARTKYAKELILFLRQQDFNKALVPSLQEALQPWKGEGCPVCVDYECPDARARVRLGEDWRVVPADDLVIRLQSLFGRDRVKLEFY
ncbi:MAG: hypothetical protein D6758_00130, partial [Gammaproteobacteria bacterium]